MKHCVCVWKRNNVSLTDKYSCWDFTGLYWTQNYSYCDGLGKEDTVTSSVAIDKFQRSKLLWLNLEHLISSVQFSSVAQSCLTFCDPMDCSMPGLPVYHQLPEFTPTHVHWVGDDIQPSHPLSSLLLLPSIFPRTFPEHSIRLCK